MGIHGLIFLAAFLTLSGIAASPVLADFDGEPARWIQNPALSPDGTLIAFTHRGQVFLTDHDGGLSIPVSPGDAYSHSVVWAPDSKRLAFASDVNGDDDVYLADFSGKLRRMTYSSAKEIPTSFSPDGKSVLYTAVRLGDPKRSIQAALSWQPQLYAVDTKSGRERLLLPNAAREARWNKDQTKLVYSYDPSADPVERQHRVAANARQLWLYDPANGKYNRLFEADGVDRLDPHWSIDGESLFYLSEASGWLNVWKLDLKSGQEVQLTHFEGAPVRNLSVADDGTTAFGFKGQVFMLAAGSDKPQAVHINTLEQGMNHLPNYKAVSSQDFRSSPDGRHFALIANSDVFLVDIEGNYRQLTNTAGEERDIAFSPDGKWLAYAALRDHKWGIYGIDLSEDQQSGRLGLSHPEIPLIVSDQSNLLDPKFSPDGSKLAFWSDRREVKVMDLANGQISALHNETDYNSDYFDKGGDFSWSPTSKDLLVPWRSVDGSVLNRVAIVSADGSAPLQPLLAMVPNFYGGFWSADGTQLIGYTTLYTARSADNFNANSNFDLYRIFLSPQARQDYIAALDRPSDPKGDKQQTRPEIARYVPERQRSNLLEGRLTTNMQTPEILTTAPDGKNLLAIMKDDQNLSVNLLSLENGELEEVASIPVAQPEQIQFIRYNEVLQTVDIKMPDQIVRISASDPTQRLEIPLNILFTRDEDAALVAAFEQAWADVNDRYYDAVHENRDWEKIGSQYRAYLPSIAGRRDLERLLASMFGELSASHLFTAVTGINTSLVGVGTQNDALGIYWDDTYSGVGQKIAAILPGGPMDRESFGIGSGDIITSINAQPIPEAGGVARLLDINSGRPVVVGVADGKTGKERFIEATPISWRDELILSSKHLSDKRRTMVDQLSRQCIAYQYLDAMNNDNYLSLIGTLSSQRGLAKAALIDVRSNIGGNLSRQLLTLLSGKLAFSFGLDGRAHEFGPDNVWLWPSAVLVDSFSYSDGSIFPQAYQDQKIGPLIGDIVLNTGTSVTTVDSNVVPGLQYRFPVLPYRHVDGRKYENEIITPDIVVPFDPNTFSMDADPQLEAAVASLMREIGVDSDCLGERREGRPGDIKLESSRKK
ncbi:S41 family peptidase [Brucella pseudogrignonensis]|uniref:S41 family peptidase n=1 Tax=Brucella pseudogrignonensis TaxID=419475 RepID=UPI00190A2A86|nr:S41 family peptidase [Brucella pseudogrignonensis]MBK0022862.1 PD40 domain-containing protein [Ochrobactrum sp. S45]MBK0044877.1 PD40 domain-containing protein [Ochrobactrum sp. S46]UKK95372.1 S41 family peptidase [Brucella pseudogrignonensis]